MKTEAEVDRYVLAVMGPRDKRTADLIESSWVNIARMYHDTGALEKAVQYLAEFLDFFPSDSDANVLAGQIYEQMGDFESAFQRYSATSNAHPQLIRVALKLHTQQHFLAAINKMRARRTKLKQDTLLALNEYYGKLLETNASDLQNETVTATEWLLSLDEVVAIPRLHMNMLKVLMSAQMMDSAWGVIVGSCRTFIDDLEWSEFVFQHLDAIQKVIGSESLDVADYFFFGDNVARLSLKQKSIAEAEVDLDNFHQLLNANLVPNNMDVMHDVKASRKWSRTRLEYLSRYYLYYGLLSLKRMDVPFVADEETRSAIKTCYSSLILSLSYTPDMPSNEVDRICTKWRIGTAARTLLAVLCCFNFDWIYGISAEAFPDSESAFVDSGCRFFPITYSDIRLGLASYPKRLVDILRVMKNLSYDVDSVIADSPWDLRRVISVSAWRMLDGSLRSFLRQMFPEIPEYSSVRSLKSGLEPRNPNKSIMARPSVTLADIEALFVIALLHCWGDLIKRMDGSVEEGDDDGVDQPPTLGLVILALQEYLICVPQNLIDLWYSLLFHYGNRTDVQRARYSASVWSEMAISNALSEIRGDKDFGTDGRRAYLLMAVTFSRMFEEYQVDRSIEAVHYYRAAARPSALNPTVSPIQILPASDILDLISWSTLEETDIREEIENIASFTGSRYRRYVLDDANHAILPSLSESRFAETTITGAGNNSWIQDTSIINDDLENLHVSKIVPDAISAAPGQQTANLADMSMLSVAQERPAIRSTRLIRQMEKLKQLRSSEFDQNTGPSTLALEVSAQPAKMVPKVSPIKKDGASSPKPAQPVISSRMSRKLDMLKQLHSNAASSQ